MIRRSTVIPILWLLLFTQQNIFAAIKELVSFPNGYIGKAYIISTHSLNLSHDDGYLPDQLSILGFQSVVVPAMKPYQYQFSSLSQISEFCLNTSHTSFMKQAEIALVCGHLLAIEFIANDPDLENDDWGMVLEDDARFNFHNFSSSEILFFLHSSMDYTAKNHRYGFIYGGFKPPTFCSNHPDFLPRNRNAPFQPACRGFGSHSYMVNKRTAKVLYRDLLCPYDVQLQQHICGVDCSKQLCQIDQLLFRLFGDYRANATKSMRGFDLLPAARFRREPTWQDARSPYFPTATVAAMHTSYDQGNYGIAYPCCQTGKEFVKGTSLKSIPFIETKTSYCFFMQPSTSHGDDKVTRVSSSSMSELLFQYATLVSVCVRNGVSPQNCAGFIPPSGYSHNGKSPQQLKNRVRFLFEYLSAPNVTCNVPSSTTNVYREIVHKRYPGTIIDDKIFSQPFETQFQGKFHSIYYFHEVKHFLNVFFQPSKHIVHSHTFQQLRNRLEALTRSLVQTTRISRIFPLPVRQHNVLDYLSVGNNSSFTEKEATISNESEKDLLVSKHVDEPQVQKTMPLVCVYLPPPLHGNSDVGSYLTSIRSFYASFWQRLKTVSSQYIIPNQVKVLYFPDMTILEHQKNSSMEKRTTSEDRHLSFTTASVMREMFLEGSRNSFPEGILSEVTDPDIVQHIQFPDCLVKETRNTSSDGFLHGRDKDVYCHNEQRKDEEMRRVGAMRHYIATHHCDVLVLSQTKEAWWAGYLSGRNHWKYASNALLQYATGQRGGWWDGLMYLLQTQSVSSMVPSLPLSGYDLL